MTSEPDQSVCDGGGKGGIGINPHSPPAIGDGDSTAEPKARQRKWAHNGGDVRGDGCTDDGGSAAAVSSIAAYRDKYGDERTKDVGAAAASSSTAAYRNKNGDESTNNFGAAAVASSTAAYCDKYVDKRTNDVGAAAAASSTAWCDVLIYCRNILLGKSQPKLVPAHQM